MDDMIKSALEFMLSGIAENMLLKDLIVWGTSNYFGIFGASGALEPGGVVTGVIKAVVPIAIAICVLFFFTSFVDACMSDRLNLETIVKKFLNLAVGLFGVWNAEHFVQLGVGVSGWIDDLIIAAINSGSAVSSDTIKQGIENSLDSGSGWLFMLLTAAIIGIVAYLASLILAAAALVICMSRLIEMGLRACFMPIAISFLSDDGFKGAGGRYIKKFIALACQGPALLIISTLHMNIISSAIANIGSIPIAGGVGSLLVLLGASFAAIGLCFKSVGIVNDVFGV